MKKLLALCVIITTLVMAGCHRPATGIDAFKDNSAEQIYTEGENAMYAGSYKDAIARFEALDALYPFSPYAENSQLHIIFAYYKSDDIGSGIASADRYIHLYPRSEHVDYAYFMKGRMKMEMNKTWIYSAFPMDPSARDLSSMRDAFTDFRDMIRFYPKSPYASDARKRMIFIRDVLAKHELDVGKFYFKRAAYVAAANRGVNVVEHFEGSSQVPGALRLMVRSYRKLGKYDMANDALRVLRRNYSGVRV